MRRLPTAGPIPAHRRARNDRATLRDHWRPEPCPVGRTCRAVTRALLSPAGPVASLPGRSDRRPARALQPENQQREYDPPCRIVVTRGRKHEALEPAPLLIELAASDDPPTELKAHVARLAQAGATVLRVGTVTDKGVVFAISAVAQAQSRDIVLMVRSPRVFVWWPVNLWPSATAPIRLALDVLIELFEGTTEWSSCGLRQPT